MRKGEKEIDLRNDEIIMTEEKLPKKYDYKYQNPIFEGLKNGLFYIQYFFKTVLKKCLWILAMALKILVSINVIFIAYFGWKVFVIGGERYLKNLDIFTKVLITEIVFFLLLIIIRIGKKFLSESGDLSDHR